MYEFRFEPTEEAVVKELLQTVKTLNDAGMDVEAASVQRIVEMIASRELDFGGRIKALAYLRHVGLTEGVRVVDWAGNTGVIPPEKDLKRMAYDYTLCFINDAGQQVFLTNGVHEARIVS